MIEFHEIKTVVVGLDSEAELPEVIHEWTQCIEGDILEPTPGGNGVGLLCGQFRFHGRDGR